jgi:hypothetical protein
MGLKSGSGFRVGMMNPTTGLFLRRIPVDECPCLIPDENDNCIDCGKHIDLSLPEGEEMPNLGDIVGICQLIDKTAATYAAVVRENSDPKDPSQPRLRMVGNRMMRLPHKALFNELMKPAYKEAKALGYRGTIERFAEHVEEHAPRPSNSQL